MDSIVVRGGRPLHGQIAISGSKNAALPIIAASLLTDALVTISNVPKLTDISTMLTLLGQLGSEIQSIETHDHLTISIDSSSVNNLCADYETVRKMRASIWVLGPLLARFGKAEVALPGGCALGARQVDLHIAALTAMGADIKIEHGYIYATSTDRLKAINFYFDKVSVGATINTIMAATIAEGTTYLFNCAKEPEIVDLCEFLISIGAEIQGIGTDELIITGQSSLRGGNYKVMPDRIEAGTYMIAAAITKGDLSITNIDCALVENLSIKLEMIGLKVTRQAKQIRVQYNDILNSIDINTRPYPGFATDLQAQMMALLTVCNGTSVITENIFENRFMHVPELCRMGANISVNGNSAIVRGVHALSGARVMASDLRASVSLILAGLVAKDETIVSRVYHLDRGYQNLEQKLVSCGADIQRIK